ncbi:MAG: hypothetical protein IJG33_12020 [Selenomonadaceae bacterium]|nr:hypothetical protein [Selenomonadaceae bacterium]MBQ3443956.1 hypothetical protein [Selenomonadaceae bacterium]
MCTVFNCLAYNDVDATIRLDGQVVFIALDDRNTSVHITLNPLQVRTLAKYLSVALTQIDFANLLDEQHFGNLTVQIEQDDDEELAAAS